jgi:hypothetical protein
VSARLPVYDGLIFGSKIRLIQTARNQLDMSDADYRALLLRTAGVSSSKAVTLSRFDAVMAEFKRLGFEQKPPKKKPKVAAGSAENRPTARQWKLLEDRARQAGYGGLEDQRFIAWMKPRGHVEHPRFLTKATIQPVLAALGKWLQRQAERPPPPRTLRTAD